MGASSTRSTLIIYFSLSVAVLLLGQVLNSVDDQNAVCLAAADLGRCTPVQFAAREKDRGLKKKSGLRPKKRLHPNDGPAKIQLRINRRRLPQAKSKCQRRQCNNFKDALPKKMKTIPYSQPIIFSVCPTF